MCVAIVQLAGKRMTDAQLYAGWSTNSDGGGFAFLDKDKKVQIDTGYLTYNEFQKKYVELTEQYGKYGPMLVHMRIRSAGGLGKKNCHPFRIKGGAMIHNGTLFYPENDRRTEDSKSDTRIFADALHNILDLASVRVAEKDILAAVGTFNKLAFLYDGGDYHIMNEQAAGCRWEDGIWYSNGSCVVSAHHPANVKR